MLRPICNSQEKKRRTLNPRICQKTQKENNSGVETCLITTSFHDFLTRNVACQNVNLTRKRTAVNVDRNEIYGEMEQPSQAPLSE